MERRDRFVSYPTLHLESGGMAYLAGPVRALGRQKAIELRRDLELLLFHDYGLFTYNPPGAWLGDGDRKSEEYIRIVNLTAVALCSVMAVIFLPNVESRGTEEELEIAVNMGKRVIILVEDGEHLSKAIAWVLQASPNRKAGVQVDFCYMQPGRLVVAHELSLGKVKK